MKQNIVVMGGSFNPPTVAHYKLIDKAMQAIGATEGILVPSSHDYVEKKMHRAYSSGAEQCVTVYSEDLRLKMLRAMIDGDSRLSVDDLEYHRTEKGYTYDTMLDLKAKYPDATLYFLAGGDKIDIFPRWHHIEEFLDRFHMIVVKRDGDDPKRAIEAHPFLSRYKEKFRVIEAPSDIDGISSSAVRALLRHAPDEAKAMLHPEVFRMLEAPERPKAISSFRNEYRFLSNFFPVPVEYKGLRFENNEAAFQAQKCLGDAEKLQFTSLSGSDAKCLGRRVKLRPDWDAVKVGIMEDLVRAKFTQNEEMRRLLLETGDAELRECNTWNDVFWGISAKTGKGENHLGRILMKIRDELRNAFGE